MSVDLRAASTDYLRGRRARGYKLVAHGRLIAGFLDLLDAQGATTVTVADALAFARGPAPGPFASMPPGWRPSGRSLLTSTAWTPPLPT